LRYEYYTRYKEKNDQIASYDPVTQQSTENMCPTCYGTTYNRGYLSPVEIWAQFEPYTKVSNAGTILREEEGANVKSGNPETMEGEETVLP
jgi:hypothetical protein